MLKLLVIAMLAAAQVASAVPASAPSCEPARHLVTSLGLAHSASESPASGTRRPLGVQVLAVCLICIYVTVCAR